MIRQLRGGSKRKTFYDPGDATQAHARVSEVMQREGSR